MKKPTIQTQIDVDVCMLNGRPRTRRGIATGNNAAWLCDCGYDQPLVGTTLRCKNPVECKKCNAQYKIYPKEGRSGKQVQYIQRIP